MPYLYLFNAVRVIDQHLNINARHEKKSLECLEGFRQQSQKSAPSAVECLECSIDACLTFSNFPPEEWISLRTTNIIERPNKAFRRRTEVMEIVAGKMACGRILANISLKMVLRWRSTP